MHSLPYVRCVGIGTDIYQNEFKKAYDSRMICVLDGAGTVEVDAKKYSVKSGDVFIITPGTKYRVRSKQKQKTAVINFDTNYNYCNITEPVLSVNAEEFCEEKILKCEPISFLTDISYTISAGELDLFEDLYRTFLRDDMETDVKDFVLSSKFSHIISKIITQSDKTDGISSAVYKYIIDNVCEKLTAESVAKHFNYSSSYIEKLLRKDHNISFRQLIIETRLKKALWLLENTSKSCSEISSELGFYSAQHFTQMFRKKYSIKPTDLRK